MMSKVAVNSINPKVTQMIQLGPSHFPRQQISKVKTHKLPLRTESNTLNNFLTPVPPHSHGSKRICFIYNENANVRFLTFFKFISSPVQQRECLADSSPNYLLNVSNFQKSYKAMWEEGHPNRININNMKNTSRHKKMS